MLLNNGLVLGQWVDVKDRLPEKDKIVLWYHEDGLITQGDIPHDFDADDIMKFLKGKKLMDEFISITHWIDLDSPRKVCGFRLA